MPAYISHAIMGNDLYKNLISDANLVKVPIKDSDLRGFSLGIDMASLSPKVIKDPHNFYTQTFFINMINYIRENKLEKNIEIISLLYGHMAHYFLDINIHPLVYYIESSSKKVGLIPNHHLVEGYYDSYFAKVIMGHNLSLIKPEFFNQINFESKEVKELLSRIYGKVYHDYNIICSYKKLLSLFTMLEKVLKDGKISQKFLIKLSRLKEFMTINKLSFDELVNEKNAIYTNPVTGKRQNDSLIQLYHKSIDMCLEAIKIVNRYLYGNYSLDSLEKVFRDLSYDTGVSCSLGKKMIYVRK